MDQSTKPGRFGKLINLGRFEDLTTTTTMLLTICLSTMLLYGLYSYTYRHMHFDYDMVTRGGKPESHDLCDSVTVFDVRMLYIRRKEAYMYI